MELAGADAGPPRRGQRVVIVAGNSLIVEAIRAGLRRSGDFHVVAHANGTRPSARQIAAVEPDVALVDECDQSEWVIGLIREIRAQDERIAVIILTARMDPEWLRRGLAAGAIAAISKASHPIVLGTLLRATLSGHIVHRLPDAAEPPSRVDPPRAGELPLTTREVEILQLVAAGFTNGEVARRLWVTEQTVKFHLRNVYRKLGVANRTEASHLAHVRGLMDARRGLTAVAPDRSVPA
jgi:DNA-binding NarL/FixJ family response regulator